MVRCCAGNEPDLLAAWQFNFAGNNYANYTQYWTRKMLDIKYSTTADVRRVEPVPSECVLAACPALNVYPHAPRLHAVVSQGLPGNDDFGTMSAWEVWAYMGLYPLTGSRRAWRRCCVTHPSPSVPQQVQANSRCDTPTMPRWRRLLNRCACLPERQRHFARVASPGDAWRRALGGRRGWHDRAVCRGARCFPDGSLRSQRHVQWCGTSEPLRHVGSARQRRQGGLLHARVGADVALR